VFENESGFNQAALAEDPLTAKGIGLWLERVLGFYGGSADDPAPGGVDVQVIEEQLLLVPKTREYIYEGDFTPREIAYVAGSRPMLEEVVAEVVTDGMSDEEKALAIMRRCRDNRDRGLSGSGRRRFNGGSEEDLLRMGAIQCNEISRVFACLCQVAGLRARLMCAHISGHMMAEAEVDGRWWWIDPMQGCYCYRDDGGPASTWDLVQDPTLFERQPAASVADVRPTGPFPADCDEARSANIAHRQAKNRFCYFHPKEAVAIGNYFAWEREKYSFPWFTKAADPGRLFRARCGEARNRRALGWPDFYFNPHLLEWQMKSRD